LLWIFDIDLPLGSFIFLNASSHSSACGVLHATDGTDGTDSAAVSLEKWLKNIER